VFGEWFGYEGCVDVLFECDFFDDGLECYDVVGCGEGVGVV